MPGVAIEAPVFGAMASIEDLRRSTGRYIDLGRLKACASRRRAQMPLNTAPGGSEPGGGALVARLLIAWAI